MKKTLIYLSLMAILAVNGSNLALAAEAPPAIQFDFADDSASADDDAPPALGAAPAKTEPVKTQPAANTYKAPAQQSAQQNAVKPAVKNQKVSKTGPEVGYLLLASLLGGYFYQKKLKKYLQK